MNILTTTVGKPKIKTKSWGSEKRSDVRLQQHLPTHLTVKRSENLGFTGKNQRLSKCPRQSQVFQNSLSRGQVGTRGNKGTSFIHFLAMQLSGHDLILLTFSCYFSTFLFANNKFVLFC